MGKLIGNVHSDVKPRKVSDSKKSEKSSQTSSASESRSSRKVSEEKETGIIKGVHKSEDDYVSLDIDDDEDSSSSRRSRSSRQRQDVDASSSHRESAQNAIDSAKENIERIKESSSNFFANGLKDNKKTEKPAQSKEDKETDDIKEQEAQEAKEAEKTQEAIDKQEADNTQKEAQKIEEKALKAAGVDADVEIPENLKGNYYGIYNYLVSEQSEGYHEAQLAAQKLMSDENIWDPSSMSTSKEKLKEKIEGIFNVKGSVFQGKDVADTIVEAALENNLNPEMFAAKIMAENDLGTGSRSHTYKNPGWVRGADQTYKMYGSINEGIRDMAGLLGNAPQYNLSQGSKSMVEVDSVYAPGNTAYSEFLAKRLIAIQQYKA